MCYDIYVLLWIKHCLVRFNYYFSFNFIQILKASQHLRNSGCKFILSDTEDWSNDANISALPSQEKNYIFKLC